MQLFRFKFLQVDIFTILSECCAEDRVRLLLELNIIVKLDLFREIKNQRKIRKSFLKEPLAISRRLLPYSLLTNLLLERSTRFDSRLD